ncbi:MAG: hypothetical protein N4A33_10615 [Bacteriovoracaceae bacterium]|nr:hypothetical protein [Bacteriovoracaceae bacterium]
MSLTLGICQYENSYRWDKTYIHAINTIKYFKRRNADIVCFQEAFLSGYGAESLLLDYEFIDSYLELIKEYAYELDICVMIPSLIMRNLKIYNATYIFNHDGKDTTIFKQGLTPSEKIILHSKKSKKFFNLKGYNIGVIICREVEDKPFTYFSKHKVPDLLLWPSYWGWRYKSKWGAKKDDGKRSKAFSLIKKLKVPMIQINMSKSSDAKGKLIKSGKSVVVNKDASKVGVGAFAKNDRYLVYFDGINLVK